MSWNVVVRLTADSLEVFQNAGEVFASTSCWLRIPLSPELSTGAMTNGVSQFPEINAIVDSRKNNNNNKLFNPVIF